MASLTLDQPHVQTLTQKDLEKFWGSAKDPHSIRNIIAPILSGLKAAHERGEIPKVKWSLCGSCAVNEFVAPIFRKVHDKDFKLVCVVPFDTKVETFHKIKEIVGNSLEFLPRNQFDVTRPTYSMQDLDLSFSVCRVSKLHDENELPLEIAIELISRPDVRMHVLNLDSVEVTGSEVLSEDESETYQLRSKEVKEGEPLEPVLEDIRNHLVSSSASLETSSGYARGEWPRYIFSVTDGALEKDLNTNLYFFLGAQGVGNGLPNQIRFWIGQKRGDIPNYEFYATINALNHCVSPEERSDMLQRQLEENPQAVAAWMDKKLYMLKRLEKQIPALKRIIAQFEATFDARNLVRSLEEQAPLVLKQFLEGEDLRPYFISHLKTLVQDKNLEARSEMLARQMEENLPAITGWLQENLSILKRLEYRIPILKGIIEQFEATSDARSLLRALEERSPAALKSLAEVPSVKSHFILQFQSLAEDKALQLGMQGTWIHFLRRWAEIPMSDFAFLEGIKRFVPLFADAVFLKKHRDQAHLQCVFNEGEEQFYVPIPLLSPMESQKLTVISEKQDMALLQPLDESLQANPLSHFLLQDETHLAKISQEKAIAQSVLKSAREGDVSSFANKLLLSQMLSLEQIEALLPMANLSPQLARNLVRQIFTMYPNDKITASLSQKLIQFVSACVAAEEDKKPWQALYISLVLSSSSGDDLEKSRFLWAMENTLGAFSLAQFPKLIPDLKTRAIYSVRKYHILHSIASEKALVSLRQALEIQDLKKHLREIYPQLEKMKDPFHFQENFQKFSKEKEGIKQLQLLSLQGDLFGYEDLIPFYAALYKQSTQAIQERVESSCLKALESFLPDADIDQVLAVYRHGFVMPSVASVIEGHPSLTLSQMKTFIGNLQASEKKQHLAMYTSRLQKMPFEKAKDIIPHLYSLGMKQEELETLLLNLYKQDERFVSLVLSDFPHLIEPLLVRLSAPQEKIWFHKFCIALGENGNLQAREKGWNAFANDFESLPLRHDKSLVLELAKRYLKDANDMERSAFAFVCARARPATEICANAFHEAVGADFPVQSWESYPWTPALIQSTWHLMKGKTQKQIEDFVALSIGIIPKSKEYKNLWQEISCYLNEASRGQLIEKMIDELNALGKAKKQDEIAAYLSFLTTFRDFPSHLTSSLNLYTAFLKVCSVYVSFKVKDRDFVKNLLMIMQLLGEPFPFAVSLEVGKAIRDCRVQLGFAILETLRDLGSAFHKIDINWLIEDVIESLDDPQIRAVLQESGAKHSEFSAVFLERFIPHLNDRLNTQQTLLLVHDLLLGVSSLPEPVLRALSMYVQEMYACNESSIEVFMCSKALIALAARENQEQIIQDLVENIHKKRLEKAIYNSSHREVVLELSAIHPFLLMNKSMLQSVQQMLFLITEYSLAQIIENFTFLELFKDKSVASAEMSLFVVYLIHAYMGQSRSQYRAMPIEELTYHLREISHLPLSRTSCYEKLHALADSFLAQCDRDFYITPSTTAITETSKWSHTLADANLSQLSRELIKLFLSRRQEEDLEKIKQLILGIHVDRMELFQYINPSDLFADVDAYCLYLENVVSLEKPEKLFASAYLVTMLKKMVDVSESDTAHFINRILEASSKLCIRGKESFTGFCLSMGALQILSDSRFFDLMDPKFKPKIIPLLEFAYNCDWEGKRVIHFLERLEAVTAISPKSITDEWIRKSFNKAYANIKTMQVDSEVVEAVTYLARVIPRILLVQNTPKFTKEMNELLMKLLIEVKRVSPSALDLILEQIVRSLPSRDIKAEFRQYCMRNSSS
ncbi:MAG: hypothetical protein K2Y01_11295 [Rhabdochlamydiaceae bacterium]|nr:hypothetical protein [Rhabdochlamydiaceae bacterium]